MVAKDSWKESVVEFLKSEICVSRSVILFRRVRMRMFLRWEHIFAVGEGVISNGGDVSKVERVDATARVSSGLCQRCRNE